MPPRQQSKKKEEDGLYLDEEDKKQLELLPEAAREEILYERHMRKTEAKERQELKHRRREFGDESDSESESKDVYGIHEKAIPRIVSKTSFDVFKNVVLRRDDLISIVYRRAIDRLKGYYVKIRLPEGYCVYRILRVYEDKRYEVNGVVTNKWMSLGRNKDRKEVNIQSISNAPVTKEEYSRYARENTIEGGDKEILRLYKKLSRDLESGATEEELNYSLTQKRRFSKYGKIAVKRRIELKVMLERAKAEDRQNEVEEIEKELKEIEDAAGSE
ncbi:hypothetical protein NEMIN01_0861 [Nematocida minor]|uniref:uncharacterized protein n=1 Tax=Nematocida minor TaxID=1912983 RepID=UPI002221222A|nr:uncharacterized protein NEMIN01_0861 [Nematocida minor]KAI5190076.1 hypothetical protein NEMIN01_0861 [Nematocida minor]